MKSSWKDDQVKAISEKQLNLNVMTAAWSYWKTAVVSHMSCVGCSALIWKLKQKINAECQDIIFTETIFQLCFMYLFYSHVLESCLLFILLWVTVLYFLLVKLLPHLWNMKIKNVRRKVCSRQCIISLFCLAQCMEPFSICRTWNLQIPGLSVSGACEYWAMQSHWHGGELELQYLFFQQ